MRTVEALRVVVTNAIDRPGQTERTSWWKSNWKWVAPIGCIGLLAVIAAFVTAIVMFVAGIMKSNDVYRTAVERANSSAELRSILGEPMQFGWFLSGNINVSGPSGDANLKIPVSGPKGSCTIYAVATKNAGLWEYEILEAACEAQPERIDLIGITFRVERFRRFTFGHSGVLEKGTSIELHLESLSPNQIFNVNQCIDGCSKSLLMMEIRGDAPSHEPREFIVEEEGRYYFWILETDDSGAQGPVMIERLHYADGRLKVHFEDGTIVAGMVNFPEE